MTGEIIEARWMLRYITLIMGLGIAGGSGITAGLVHFALSQGFDPVSAVVLAGGFGLLGAVVVPAFVYRVGFDETIKRQAWEVTEI